MTRNEVIPFRPFRIVGKDKSVFRINEHNDVEVLITGARFTTVPDNRWTVRVSNLIASSNLEYYNEPFEQPEAFTEEEKYRYAKSKTKDKER